MNCSFTEKISSLIDGELATAEARDVERHMLGCNECQQVRADFLNLRTQIAGFETSLQPEVQNRALRKILGTEHRAPARGLRWSFGAPAVAFATLLIAAAIIGLLFYQNFTTRDRNSEQVAAVQQQGQSPSPAPSGSVEQSRQQQPQATPEPGREQPPAPGKGNDETPRRQPSTPKKIVREPKPGEQFAAVPGPIRSADAQTLTAMHFEKSETLLLSFRNIRLNQAGKTAKVAYERKRAQQLVYQNMMLRREADAAGDVQISSLLESLEPILIDIANLPERPDDDAVRVIRQRVERKNIVPLLRVNSTALARALD